MKTPISVLGFALLLYSADAQQHFANGGFEDYTSCPSSVAQASRIVGYSGGRGTPDYYNCSYRPTWAKSGTGSLYMGAIKDPSNNLNTYEGINVKLDLPLVEGEKYQVSISNRYGTSIYGHSSFDYSLIRDCYSLKLAFGMGNQGGNPSIFHYQVFGDTDVGNANTSYKDYHFTFTASESYTHLYLITVPEAKTDANSSECISAGAKAYVFYNVIDDLSIEPFAVLDLDEKEMDAELEKLIDTGTLTNNTEREQSVILYSVTGKTIEEKGIAPDESFILESETLAHGLYLLRYWDGDVMVSKKFWIN